MNATITINGLNYNGKSVSISNGVISIDGRKLSINDKTINISVVGDIQQLQVDSCQKVDVSGNVKNLETVSGNVRCGNVAGDVETTSGDIKCGDVGGNIETVSGDVEASTINGKVSTLSGDINT